MGLEAFTYEAHPDRVHKLAIIIKENSMHKEEIYNNYVEPLLQKGLKLNDIAVYSLQYAPGNKAPAAMARTYLTDNLLPALEKFKTRTILCADPTYFKILTGILKPEMHYGYVEKGKHPGYTNMDIILSVNYGALFYNPRLKDKITMSLDAVTYSMKGVVIDPGSDIIHSETYPKTLDELTQALKSLHAFPALTVDVETYSLKFQMTGIATIQFAWDEHNFLAFPVNWYIIEENIEGYEEIDDILIEFFEDYEGLLIYHGATFDLKILVHSLFMTNYHDTEGMLLGLETMTKNIACTKIITYLATNSTAGNKLDLKSNAQEFTGNYGLEGIEDITQYDLPELLRYNGIDGLATWYLYKKHWSTLQKEGQLRVYQEIMQPSIKTVVQMELTGMPMEPDKIRQANKQLTAIWDKHKDLLKEEPAILILNAELKLKHMLNRQAKLKVKVLTLEDIPDQEFNPGSSQQVAMLLHDQLGLPVTDKTPTGNPSVGGDTLKKHLNQLKSEFGITDKDLK